MPPANATSVTWMLLNITWNENAEAGRGVVVAALGRRVGGRLELARGSGPRPPARRPRPRRRPATRGPGQQQPGGEHEPGPLGQPDPVAAREERATRRAAARARVDRARARSTSASSRADQRLAGKAPPREREVGGRRAVELAEPADAVAPELLGAVAGPPAAPRRAPPRPLRALGREPFRSQRSTAAAGPVMIGTRMEYEDRRTISTPEGVQLELPLAGIGSRFMAMLIDYLIGGVACLIVSLATLVAAAGSAAAIVAVDRGAGHLRRLLRRVRGLRRRSHAGQAGGGAARRHRRRRPGRPAGEPDPQHHAARRRRPAPTCRRSSACWRRATTSVSATSPRARWWCATPSARRSRRRRGRHRSARALRELGRHRHRRGGGRRGAFLPGAPRPAQPGRAPRTGRATGPAAAAAGCRRAARPR